MLNSLGIMAALPFPRYSCLDKLMSDFCRIIIESGWARARGRTHAHPSKAFSQLMVVITEHFLKSQGRNVDALWRTV